MLPFKAILHPTDFSSEAEAAFELACLLARGYHGQLIVLHVEPVPPMAYGGVLMAPPPVEDTTELRAKLESLQADGLQVEHELHFGLAGSTICEVAASRGCDLIVMGSHRNRPLHDLLLGSVVAEVVRHALCPVLTVHAPVHSGGEPAVARTEKALV